MSYNRTARQQVGEHEQEFETTESQSKSNKVRINVNLSENTYQQLNHMADDRGVGMSEFVRNALRVYTSLLDELRHGKTIYVGTQDKIEKELLIP
jgi:hypothetical protein